MVYFDNAATSFPKPDSVYDAIMSAMKDYGANPGRSGHKMALKLSREIYNTREMISKMVNIGNPMNAIMIFNATQGLNMGIRGVLKEGDHVITTSMEHNSVLRPIKYLEGFGVENTIVKADSMGRINPADIKDAIKKNTKLIVCTHISNLTGTIMPVEEIGKIAKENGILYMLDASQSVGVYDVDVETMNIDLMAFPGHKALYGPQGTGIFYVKEGVEINTIIQGGTGSASDSPIQPDTMPDKFESGTENGPGIVGLGAGIKFINEKGMANIREHKKSLTKHFIEEVEKINGIEMYGPLNVEEQTAVVALNIKDADSSEVSYVLDQEYDIAVRPGIHCAPLAHETLGTLERGAIRFSFGYFNTHEEIEYAVKALRDIAKEV